MADSTIKVVDNGDGTFTATAYTANAGTISTPTGTSLSTLTVPVIVAGSTAGKARDTRTAVVYGLNAILNSFAQGNDVDTNIAGNPEN